VTRDEWLASLTEGSRVAVYINGNRVVDEVLTRTNDSYVTIGKWGMAKRFNRKTGILCGTKALKHLFRLEQP
jgi:hypothetical protein